jgi:hypothetical protein
VRSRERGAGLIGTIAGVVVFLAFLTFAVQLLVNLYTASVVTSATYDAARLAATDDRRPRDLAAAEALARDLLGDIGDDARFTWDLSDPDVIALRVEVRSPRFLMPAIDTALGFDTIDRTVRVRVEEVQP